MLLTMITGKQIFIPYIYFKVYILRNYKMYWSDVQRNLIYQANLDSSSISTIVSTGISDPG